MVGRQARTTVALDQALAQASSYIIRRMKSRMKSRLLSRFTCAQAMLLGLLASISCIRRAGPVQGSTQVVPILAATVTLVQAERHQTLEGFGASIAWYQSTIVPKSPPGVFQLLFPDLGLDILRFRNRYQRMTKPEDNNIAEDVEILQKATAALGHRPKILLSAWSPPASLKASGKEDCNGNKDCTLAKEGGQFAYEKFADWWRDSIVHYRSVGIAPDWVSLENEPSFIPPGWEGCKFEPTETADYPGYDKALAAFHAKIATLPNPPKILGPEVLGIHNRLLHNYVAAMNLDLVDGVAHHIYEKGSDGIWDWKDPGPDSFIDEMQAVAQLTSKPLFQTEFQTDEDRGYLGGFETAWLIHNSLVEEGVVAFLYWDLVWNEGGGMVSMGRNGPEPRDQYYSVRHYARYTDPGDVRVGAKADAPAIRASAFLSPAGDRLTAIVLNTGKEPADVRIDFGDFKVAKSEIYRTVYLPGLGDKPPTTKPKSDTWVALGGLPENHAIPMPARSVATVVLSARAP
jgi:glucuronoarabinoxylan endo-1,4-beta-xylanase